MPAVTYQPAILAVDLATRVGYSIGAPRETPRYGSFKLGYDGADLGDIGRHYLSWLEEQIAAYQIGWIAWEPPWVAKIINMDVINVLVGLHFTAHTIARRHNIARLNPSTATVNRFVLGPTKIPKGKKKAMTMEAIQKLGFNPDNTDESDALAVWCWAEQHVDRGARRTVGPLFTPASPSSPVGDIPS